MRIPGVARCESALQPLLPALLVIAFAFAVASAAPKPAPIGPLLQARVIPDVIDEFRPSAEVAVRYGGTQVVDGHDIRPSIAAKPPDVRIRGAGCGSSGDLYALVMSDPDAPSPSNPSKREWLHWIVVDVPGGSDITKGKELVPYAGPTPPIGVHRYVFAIFKQKGTLQGITTPSSRASFKTRAFAAEHGLGLPVAALYFNATKEPASTNY
ncbi:hypothetical protein Taro_018821 [Colocasia esculenta]|uniref:Uncharacterized protein n=1 Tax=Colocasia esculenta TaxID=4460 RepID=A0A843UXD7_COLES|nr:hypothetical protein [Colocasia esculenta]